MTDSIWLARDLDGELHAFQFEPYWRKEFGHWASMGESEDPSRKLPGSWQETITGGHCTRFEEAKPGLDELKSHILATYRRLMVERDNYQLDGLSGRLIQGEMLGLAGVWLFVTGQNDLAERAKT